MSAYIICQYRNGRFTKAQLFADRGKYLVMGLGTSEIERRRFKTKSYSLFYKLAWMHTAQAINLYLKRNCSKKYLRPNIVASLPYERSTTMIITQTQWGSPLTLVCVRISTHKSCIERVASSDWLLIVDPIRKFLTSISVKLVHAVCRITSVF